MPSASGRNGPGSSIREHSSQTTQQVNLAGYGHFSRSQFFKVAQHAGGLAASESIKETADKAACTAV